jgi:DNA-directed RNA polymerase subunit RPC12/RpoP
VGVGMKKEEKSNNQESDRIRCAECGTRLKDTDKECPNCGSTAKTRGPINFVRTAQVAIGIRSFSTVVSTIHMTSDSWTVLGVILGFIIPPLFYGIFTVLTIFFWYKVLIWLGITLIVFWLTRTYLVIKSLRILGKATGKRKFKG